MGGSFEHSCPVLPVRRLEQYLGKAPQQALLDAFVAHKAGKRALLIEVMTPEQG